ncbi:MAG: histidine kinase [Rubrobacteraceae bacterium]
MRQRLELTVVKKFFKRGMSSLRTLQWKLTLSYTLVTVAALLILELILIGVLLAFLNSGTLPRLAAMSFREDLAPRMEIYFQESPPDVEGLREELLLFAGESGVRGGRGDIELGGESANVGVTPDEGYLFVVDAERRLLASAPTLDDYPAGETFEGEEIPGVEPLITAALGGEDDAGELSVRTPEGRLISAAPIRSDGEVVGVLAGTFRIPNLTVPIAITVGVSVIALLIPAGMIGMIFGFVTARGPARRLQNLAAASEAWSKGDFSVAVKDKSKDEIGQLSRDLNDMAAELEALIEARQELAALETRNRFARDLHDSVKQQVFATSLQVAAAKALMSQDTKAAEAHLAQAEELVHGAQKELNVLIHEMRPAALEDRGLAPALRDYVRSWSERAEIEAGIHVRGERQVSLEVEKSVYRVAQEALANVAKHSRAAWAEVELVYSEENITLKVTDDGRGFDTGNSSNGGFGIESMSERARRLDGTCEVMSEIGRGTRVVCAFPINRTPQNENGKE